MTRKPEKTYNDLTPAERAAFDQRYRVADARKVLKRLPARIKRLRKIEAALRAVPYDTATGSDDYARTTAARALSELLEAISSDERRVSIASRDIEDGIDYRRAP